MPPIYTFTFKHKTISEMEITLDAYDLYGATKKLRSVVVDHKDWELVNK